MKYFNPVQSKADSLYLTYLYPFTLYKAMHTVFMGPIFTQYKAMHTVSMGPIFTLYKALHTVSM